MFLSYRYDDANTKLARQVEELLESHNLRAVTGDVLGGEAVTPELLQQIDEADALIALLTRRDQLAAGGWTTHPFCLDELKHAREGQKPAIALLEDGVKPEGFFKENEHISFNAAEPLLAFLKLSRTIWRWKVKAGRKLKIQLLPSPLAQEIYSLGLNSTWQYRVSDGLKDSQWQEVKARKEGQGVFLLVHVQEDTTLVDVRVEHGGKTRLSGFVPLHVPVSLES